MPREQLLSRAQEGFIISSIDEFYLCLFRLQSYRSALPVPMRDASREAETEVIHI